MRLEESLHDCTLALLRRIAANHGMVAGEATLRGELAGLLLQRLLAPGYIAGFLPSLSEAEQTLLQTVRDQGWTAKAFVLERQFPQPRPSRPSSGPPEPGPTLSLLQKGLLFRSFAAIGSWRGEVYLVPDDLQPAVTSSLPAPAEPEQVELRLEGEPETIAERDPGFEAFCLLSFLRREPRRRLVRGVLPRVDLAKLEQEVGSSCLDVAVSRWEERWRFLLHLCLAGGWVVRQGSTLVPSRGAARLLSGGAEEIRARLLERYLKDRGWSDLAAAGRVRQPLGARQVDEAAARRLLLHQLEAVSAEGWIDEGRFCETLRNLIPDFLREDYASLSWAVLDAATGVELYGPASWAGVEGEWLRYVLRGPLHWLGVVRWGLSSGGKAMGFQLRRPVASTVPEGAGVSPAPEHTTTLSLGLGGEVESPEGFQMELLYRLEPYLELSRRGRRSSYRLTRASVVRGLDTGGSWAELRELLETATGESLPPPLREEVERWVADYGRFVLDTGVILAAGTPEDADQLAQLPGTVGCFEVRLGPRVHQVVPGRVWQLVQALRKAGHQPRVDPSVRLQGARRAMGELEVLRESLFALKLLRSLRQEGVELENGSEAARRLEAALGPQETAEIARKVQAALRQIQQRG
ncbi:MAG: helicase-associated domain-containing protein [Chloroflexota bacterium]